MHSNLFTSLSISSTKVMKIVAIGGIGASVFSTLTYIYHLPSSYSARIAYGDQDPTFILRECFKYGKCSVNPDDAITYSDKVIEAKNDEIKSIIFNLLDAGADPHSVKYGEESAMKIAHKWCGELPLKRNTIINESDSMKREVSEANQLTVTNHTDKFITINMSYYFTTTTGENKHSFLNTCLNTAAHILEKLSNITKKADELKRTVDIKSTEIPYAELNLAEISNSLAQSNGEQKNYDSIDMQELVQTEETELTNMDSHPTSVEGI